MHPNGLITLDHSWDQGKSTYTFSARGWQISAFRLLALTTEAWRGAEIRRRSAEKVYVVLSGPSFVLMDLRSQKS